MLISVCPWGLQSSSLILGTVQKHLDLVDVYLPRLGQGFMVQAALDSLGKCVGEVDPVKVQDHLRWTSEVSSILPETKLLVTQP